MAPWSKRRVADLPPNAKLRKMLLRLPLSLISGCLTPAISGAHMWASPLPSRGSPHGDKIRIGDLTPIFSGVPNKKGTNSEGATSPLRSWGQIIWWGGGGTGTGGEWPKKDARAKTRRANTPPRTSLGWMVLQALLYWSLSSKESTSALAPGLGSPTAMCIAV